MKKMLLPLLLPFLLALSACTALGGASSLLTPNKNIITQAAIDLAVGAAVGNDVLTQKIKAAGIEAIAKQIQIDASSVTLAGLEATLDAKIAALAPNPADRAAFSLLLQILQQNLNVKISSGTTSAVVSTTQVAISGFAAAVISACSFYTGS